MASNSSAKRKSARKRTRVKKTGAQGKLRIGDMWNAITIIALSQNNPLKAIAEFVENSIDARAKNITLVRGKERGEHFLRITDDGEGIPCNEDGEPDFKYVATHICDSIKRRIKEQGAEGIQGEFGIGLLSFWTVGEELYLTSAGQNGRTYQMRMKKGEQGYDIQPRRTLFSIQETELLIKPLLPGIRQLTGEKIQWYLASELRDRIRTSGVKIKVLDRTARKEYAVEPRVYTGALMPLQPVVTELGEIYLELYLASHDPENCISLSRQGTRVLADITRLPHFQREPWNVRSLEGIIDAPFLRLTPGTRDGVVQDETYNAFIQAIQSVEPELNDHLQQMKDAEEEKVSTQVLKTVQRALREALIALPKEEYDWFDVQKRSRGVSKKDAANEENESSGSGKYEGEGPPADGEETALLQEEAAANVEPAPQQREFFEYEGSLHSVTVSPATCAVRVGESRTFRAITRDKSRRFVERDLKLKWELIDGSGALSSTESEIVTFTAPEECCLVRLRVVARQFDIECAGEALVTVTDSLIPETKSAGPSNARGLPGYTFEHAPSQLWRSRYDEGQNLIIVNSGHRDFVFASNLKARRLRYICRLFTKELVLKNFPGTPSEQLLERMVELSLYTEDHLR
jgi:hypothetical protein